MSEPFTDPFRMLGEEPEEPPSFEEAVSEAVLRLNRVAETFNALQEGLPEGAFTDEEWQIVERTVAEVEEAVERADEGYVAVAYDSHAWYRILESLETVTRRLESAVGMLERVRERMSG